MPLTEEKLEKACKLRQHKLNLLLQDTETKAMTNTKVVQKIRYKQAQDALNVLEWKRFTGKC
jgi:hypothetical protein